MASGYGSGWGLTPWGGFLLPSGTPPPTPPTPPDGFDIYVYYEYGPSMGAILTDPAVSTSGGSFEINLEYDLCIRSGAPAPSTTAIFLLTSLVPASWTYQCTGTAHQLPVDFSNLPQSHIYFGVADATGIAAGLFISSAGVGYTGSVSFPGGTLTLTSPFQVIPGTAGMIEPGIEYTYRIAVDDTTQTVYLFITETALLEAHVTGHRLVAILPAIPSFEVTEDVTTISVKGTDVRPSWFCISMLGLATDLFMPNVPPTADAGSDQSLRMCSVGRLDGTASRDPEGGNITYSWRLIDAPPASTFAFEGHDGFTVPLPVPTGYTSKFYSASLGSESLLDPVLSGDVVLVGGSPFSVVTTGVDGDGFYVQVTTNAFVDSLLTVSFKLLRQRFLTGSTTSRPTFYPDIPGLYKFDLVVYDGEYLSSPSTTIVNVLESQVPKGVIPDLGFLWNYLSDFWSLVEDRERIQVYWEGMAQVAAAELLNLWQVDYGKSLRDIQRTFQRRWLHYDLKLPEPLPDLTLLRKSYGGVSSYSIPLSGVSGVSGTMLVIESPVHATLRIVFVQANPFTPEKVQVTLQAKLRGVDSRYSVAVVGTSGDPVVRILAPFYFEVGADTTTPLFMVGAGNRAVSGTSGIRITARVYRVEKSLQSLDVQEGDMLVVGGEGYLISRVADDPGDGLRYQRILVQHDMPLLPGSDWTIASTVSSKLLNFYGGMLSARDDVTFEVVDSAQPGLVLLHASVLAACKEEVNKLGVDVSDIDRYLSMPTVSSRLAYVLRKTHLPIGDLVTDIPCLQQNIKETDDTAVLRRNVDYYVEEFRGANSVRMVSGNSWDPGDVWEGGDPPDRLWAEVTYFDNRPMIEANFGVPAEFTLDQLDEVASDLDYLSAVRGLWYAYLNGPTMYNLRVGSQILLGLPFSEEAGVIEEVREDFSVTQGRILVRDANNEAIVRSYHYPLPLTLEINPATGQRYAVGDSVVQFAPLVEGAYVVDYVKDPGWFEGIMRQGAFFEVEKFHRFMVQVDKSAFSLSSLMFVRSFVLRVKPTYTFPLFVVRAKAHDLGISVDDTVTQRGRLVLNDGACFNGWNYSTMLDDVRAAGGAIRNQLDTSSNPALSPPVFPVPSAQVEWGWDKNYLCPEDEIIATLRMYHIGGPVALDSFFNLDGTNVPSHLFLENGLVAVPGAGYTFSSISSVTVTGSLESVVLTVQGSLGVGDNGNYLIVPVLNSVPLTGLPITIPLEGVFTELSLTAIGVTSGDVLGLQLVPADGLDKTPSWVLISALFKQTPIPFSIDGGLPAGTYSTTKLL